MSAPEFDRALQLREEQLKRRIPGVPYRTAPIPENMRDSGKVRVGCARVSFEATPDPLPEAVAHAFEAHLEHAAAPKPSIFADMLRANGMLDDLIIIEGSAALLEIQNRPAAAQRVRDFISKWSKRAGGGS